MTASHRDYSHRDVLDKLGFRAGMSAVLLQDGWVLDPDLVDRFATRLHLVDEGAVDVVVATVGPQTDVDALLDASVSRIPPDGAIWLLTRKRNDPSYRPQDTLVGRGSASGLVDNKICSASETVSAIRFVVRREHRLRPG